MFAAKNELLTRPSGGYSIARSVRFRSSASAYLKQTFATAGNRKTYTISFWMKRGLLGSQQFMFTGFDGSTSANIQFTSGDLLAISVDGNVGYQITSSQVFRDPSAWYHFVFAVDTTQATAANRIKMYVNGVQVTALSSSSYPPQNNDTYFFGAFAHWIGSSQIPSLYTDMYMTEFNAVNGAALTPSSFGATDAITGVWQPKKYSGTYGTNGFYLKFADNSTAAALGTDSSGNSNTWTVNNISVTAGVTYDSMLDVPTLTSATVANYAVVSPIDVSSVGATISNGNLKFNNGNAGSQSTARATIGVSTGKWYWETTCTTFGGANPDTGILGTNSSLASSDQFVGNYALGYSYGGNGQKRNNNTGAAYGATYTTGDVIGVALDMDAGTLTFYKNNTSQGTAYSGLSGAFSPAISGYNGVIWDVNFGQRPFSYTPPSGFVALNTYNLSTPTIPNGAVYMAATTYTGTGASLAVANTVNSTNFQPDWVWVKGRSGATDHALYDVVRGTTKQLESNTTTAETTEATGLTAFGSTGFTVGALAQMNTSAATYVGWQWKANGTGVSNTSGTLTSTVSANTTAGFAVCTYTAPASSQVNTFGHGLGVAPSMVIAKNRSSGTGGLGWAVYHTSLGANQYLSLNSTAAASTSSGYWGSGMTSTVVGLPTAASSTGYDNCTGNMVAYVFAAVAGYSAMGSYTGNGSTDGPFVFLGFRPRFIFIKSSSRVEDWHIMDTSRSTYNKIDADLYPNTAGTEGANNGTDILSNGFKLRSTDSGTNFSGATYIYMAFAENPFKYSLAR